MNSIRQYHWFLIVTIFLVTIITLLSDNTVNAIQCWQCNSMTDKFCEDVPTDVNNLHDCYKKMYRECIDENDKLNYTFCRKQVQTIDEETRIIRSCGFIRSPVDCYWTKSPPTSTLVCQCDGDGCNHAFTAIINTGYSLFILPCIFAMVRFFFVPNLFHIIH
ncbi:hypothetical protein DERP_000946 [Dermatophagoides pteronyssinus]|uniref:Protein sleepless n=1 Tax=Dermatophagoides pteronyssinus TaxID=6956 RepID=A0ABQ8JDT0_DERPT|nr:hypothetical protein DERP_000946 [Dermatophagoides pteronyssinus]